MKTYKFSTTVAVLVLCAMAASLSAQVPSVVSYQGHLQAGGTNFHGAGLFKFVLIDRGTNVSRRATANAVVTSGFITSYVVTDGGAGYTTAPLVTITDATGSGAVALAQVSGGVVTNIAVSNPGGSYTAPTVIVALPPVSLAHVTYWSHDGTSVNGSEPTSSVTVSVEQGLFTVLLGDTNFVNMGTMPATVFTNPNPCLRIWFSDGVGGFQLLSPDQAMVSSAYTMLAETARTAGNSDMLDGSHCTAFATSGHTHSALDLTAGTLADGRLSTNVATLGGIQTFTGSKSFNGGMSVSGPVTFSSSPTFSVGAGFSGPMSVNAPATFNNGILVNGGTTLSGPITFSTSPTFNVGATINGPVNASSLATFNGGISVSGGSTLSGPVTFSGGSIVNFSSTPNFSGGGVPFTVTLPVVVPNLNADLLDGSHAAAFAAVAHTHSAADITSGTLNLARLPAQVLTNSASSVVLSGAFSGDGGGLTNIGSSSLKSDPASLVKVSGGVLSVSGGNVAATGTFSAAQTSEMQINPLTAQVVDAGLTLTIPADYGAIQVYSSPGGTYRLIVPLHVPLMLYGRKPASWSVTTHYAGASAGNYITRTRVYCSHADAGDISMTEDLTDYMSFLHSSYTVAGPTYYSEEWRNKVVEYQVTLLQGGSLRIGSIIVNYTY